VKLVEHVGELSRGLEAVGKESPKLMAAWNRVDGAAYTEGELSRKHKELMAVAISVATRCSYCIGYHVQHCFEAGATREEIVEAANVGVAFGGSPALAYMGAVLMPALEEFED
jgi:pyruvate dehydrogenase E2 component (dihydrolipoamide acetyltransferase)